MERKRVAVFLSTPYGDMVRETTEGVIDVARRNGVKLLFFTSFADNYSSRHYDRYMDYDTGDFVVYLLPDLREYDALLSFDTYMPLIYFDQMDSLKRSAHCPVISLGAVKEGACSVVNDQQTAMRKLIEHAIFEHNCRDLVHVAGIPEMTFVQERLAIFRQTLADHGLPCGDDRILYGDLSPDCGEAVVEELMARRARAGLSPLPQGIICANDYMAIGVIAALERRGYRVPADLIVTGYDDILRAQFNEPSITTSAQPFTQVGEEGMRAALRLLRGEAVEPVIAVPGNLVFRQSCGCEPFNVYKKDTIREKYIQTVTNLEALSLSTTNLILGAATHETLEDIFDEIENGCRRETGFGSAVLCLIRDWDRKRVIKDHDALKGERFDVVCGIYRDAPIRRGPLPKGALLPEEMMEDPEPYFIFPIHHLQYFMGYFIVSPNLNLLGQLHIKSWLVSISTLLENWCIRRQLTDSVRQLDHLYQTDMLTGLYNRRGYNRYFDGYYAECRAARTGLAVLLLDMNRMKFINDSYGHAEGDYCLCMIAEALRRCARHGEICIRTGGDEFVVLAKHYDWERAEAFKRAFREELARATRRDGKDYSIGVSIGCCVRVPPADGDATMQSEAELFLREADQAMYEEKKREAREA